MKTKPFRSGLLLIATVATIFSCTNSTKKETTEATEKELQFVIESNDANDPFKVTLPAKPEKITPEYAQKIGTFAYVWGWPMVNMLNRRTQITKAPQPSYLNNVLPVAPQGQLAMLNDYILPEETFVTCPNQDVVYGLGFFDLDTQPVVIQVPDFGDRFWVYAIYDQRTNQVGELGTPYQTEAGFYLLAGSNWNGETPEGINGIIKSPTTLANIIPRVFQNDTKADNKALQPLINQIMAYPLTEFDGEMKSTIWKDLPIIQGPASDGKETKWVVAEKFFDANQLGKVLEMLPPLKGEEALYAQLKELLAAAENDPAIKKALVETAVKTEEEVIGSFFSWGNNGIDAGNGWNRSYYSADWDGSGEYNYYDRTATAKSNMFDNRPNETQYYYTDNTSAGEQLNGHNNYMVTFAKGEEPPVEGFWSLTLYNKHHLFSSNELKRYSVGTKSKSLQRNEDGSLTIYIGSESPGEDKKSNWLPAPEENFSLYIRAYWGKQGVTEGTWTPPTIEKY